jgi:hypothetical protein
MIKKNSYGERRGIMEALRLLLGDNFISIIIVSVLITIIVFLIVREIVMWYWKINKIVALLEEQNSLLRKLNNER